MTQIKHRTHSFDFTVSGAPINPTTQTQHTHPEDQTDAYGICEHCGAFIAEGGDDCGCCPLEQEN